LGGAASGDENAWKKPAMRSGADVLSLLVTVVIAYKQIETFQAAMRHFKKRNQVQVHMPHRRT
jgi:hypothetical protein